MFFTGAANAGAHATDKSSVAIVEPHRTAILLIMTPRLDHQPRRRRVIATCLTAPRTLTRHERRNDQHPGTGIGPNGSLVETRGGRIDKQHSIYLVS